MIMKHKLTVLFRALLSLTLALCMALPCVMPAVAAGNTWTPGENTRIFWIQTKDSKMEDADLAKQIRLFDSELAAKVTTNTLPIFYGNREDAGDRDILLELDSSLSIAPEGYRISLTGNRILVSASDRDGLFYGCRNLIQQLLISGSVSARVDQPDVAERAVSLDNGRKYYSVEWLKAFIREMSWTNMNTLVLHFSEEMGLGIESKRYPWLAGRDGTLCTQSEVTTDNRFLTSEEIAEIVTYAKLYHVEIIPSFDSPGHMNYVVKKFNERCADQDYSFTYDGKTYTAEAGSEIGNYFHYNGKTAIVQGSRNGKYSRGIDISNEVAVAFTKSLIEEYATLFYNLGCREFDIGGDELLGWGSAVVSTSVASRWKQLDHWKEYAISRTGNSNAVAYDAFLLYMNDLYDQVTDLGYTGVRMWNDDALRSADTGWKGAVQLNKNIDIWYWSEGTNPVQTYLDAGYQVYNIINHYTYYVVSNKYYNNNLYPLARPETIYNRWNPYVFDSKTSTPGAGNNVQLHDSDVLGSAFAVWCDEPNVRTESQVFQDLIPLIRAHGAKAWDSRCNETVTYETHCANGKKIGDAPKDLPAAPDVRPVQQLDLTALQEVVAAFEATDPALYTEASYTAYAGAVAKALALAESDECTQAMLDAAVAEIQAKAAQLEVPIPEVPVPALTLRTETLRALHGKYVTLTAQLEEGAARIEICNAAGKPVTLTAYDDAGNGSVTAQFKASGSGIRTYQAYALDADGQPLGASVYFCVIG